MEKLNKWLLIAIIGVIFIWSCTLLLPLCFGNYDGPGEFGDTFGAVNALFSALAFAFLIYTVLLQRKELELQRQELVLTRKELERSAEAQKELVKLTNEQLEYNKRTTTLNAKPVLALKGKVVSRVSGTNPIYIIDFKVNITQNNLYLRVINIWREATNNQEKEITNEVRFRNEVLAKMHQQGVLNFEILIPKKYKSDNLKMIFNYEDIYENRYLQNLIIKQKEDNKSYFTQPQEIN